MKNIKIFTIVGTLVIFTLGLIFLNSCDELTTKIPENFNIRNNTGETISSVYIKMPGTILWGNSILGNYTSIYNNNSRLVSISKDLMDSENRTDIRVRTSNGIIFTKLNQKITHEGTVTFTNSDLDSSSPRTITISNITGENISNVYVRTNGTLLWGDNIIGYSSISNGGSRSVIVPRDNMDNQYRSDIQLRTSNGNLYTKLSVLIVHNETVIFTSNDLDSNSPRTITISNVTGDNISSVYIKVPGTLLWGSNVIGYSSINNGGSRSVTIPSDMMDSRYRTDIQLRTSNGNLYTRLNENITHDGTVVFTSNDLDSNSPRTITVGNVTGDTISSAYIRAAGTLLWGDNFIGYNSISNGGSRSVTIPRDNMDNQYRADIQLRTSNGILYTKLNETITHDGTIAFAFNDLDNNSPRTITIGNGTGVTISSVYIRVPGTSDWGSNIIGYSSISNGGSYSITIPRDKMNDQYRTDIQVRTSNGINYSRTSETITHRGTVNFTSGDLGG